MTFRSIVAPALVLGLGMSQAASEAATEVTYVANEGFLVEIQGKKILVDALFHDETIDWCHAPGAETLRQMESADGPFEGVDLILITHQHIDHFSPDVVLKHLASNREGTVVGPPQAVSKLLSHPAWKDEYLDRVKGVDLELFELAEMTVRGIRLEAHRIRHGRYLITDEKTGESRNKHEEVENLVYLVETGGVKFMHLGDAFLKENQDYFDGRRFPKQQLDLVFLEGWSDETLATMQASMSPRNVVFMHMPREQEKIEKIARYLASRVTNSVVFRDPMEKRSFGRGEATQ